MPFPLRDDEGRRKFHLVKWEEVRKPVSYGSLGIHSMIEMNMACMVNGCGNT